MTTAVTTLVMVIVLLLVGEQGAEQGLDVAKLMGGAQPLKEEEDMWFRQQNRSAALLV